MIYKRKGERKHLCRYILGREAIATVMTAIWRCAFKPAEEVDLARPHGVC
jgi:hypothetical protein